ncbi:hypothetical protein BDZ89DRAFT_1042399 [Hymenopellis radicata]|nr:hypothetical protein BDZ89DRAFT_1042399 [Hymenopellis radicata]
MCIETNTKMYSPTDPETALPEVSETNPPVASESALPEASSSTPSSASPYPNRNTRRREAAESKAEPSDDREKDSSGANRKARRKLSKGSARVPSAEETSEQVESIEAIPKVRMRPEGRGASGIAALHIKGHINSLDSPPVKGKLDSGADITLMSEDFFNSRRDLPALKDGMRIRLYQLTAGAKILGYTTFSYLTKTTEGKDISFEVEAYVYRKLANLNNVAIPGHKVLGQVWDDVGMGSSVVAVKGGVIGVTVEVLVTGQLSLSP